MLTQYADIFLEIDRAESVFALLFGLLRDEGTEDDAKYSFRETLQDIVGGIRLPVGAEDKLRSIYARVMENPPTSYDAAKRVACDFEHDTDVLVAIACVAFRVVNDDEMMSRLDRRLDVVTNHASSPAAGRHGTRIRVSQRDLLVRMLKHPDFELF